MVIQQERFQLDVKKNPLDAGGAGVKERAVKSVEPRRCLWGTEGGSVETWEFPSPACTGHLLFGLPTLPLTPDHLPNSVPGHLAPSPSFLPSGDISVTCLSLMGSVPRSPLINEPACRGLQTPLTSRLPPRLAFPPPSSPRNQGSPTTSRGKSMDWR